MRNRAEKSALSLPEHWLRQTIHVLVQVIMRPKVCGPAPALDEPAIFACRHTGFLDPLALMNAYHRKIVRPLIAKDYYDKNRFLRAFYRHVQCIPIDRRRASTQWLEDSVAALEKGHSILIFPEGKRNKSGQGLLPFRSGVSLLATRSSIRIIPVWNNTWKFPHRYRLTIGEPFTLDPLPPEGETTAWLRTQTLRIQDAVAALEPRCNTLK